MAKKSSTVSNAIKRGAIKKDSRQLSSFSDQTITRVRELAWTGQHAPAIDLATQALDSVGAGLSRPINAPPPRKGQGDPAPTVMDLLDLRAESYIAQGKLDLADKDAKAMMKLAKTGQKSKVTSLQVQALNRLALVQMRTGDLKGAIKSAAAAVGSKHTSQTLRAQSLFRLSEAQMRTGQNEASIESAQKAIALFQSIGDNSGTGRAYWSLANACFNLSRADDSRRAAYTALEICKLAGDQYGIGNALNAITLTDVDIAERTQHTQQALQAFEMAGYVERQLIALGNLALTYLELGLYPHSRRLQSEVVEKTRKMGAKVSLAYALGNLSEAEIKLGDLDSSRVHIHELAELTPTLGDSFMDASLATSLGLLALLEGDPKTAIRHYKAAAQIAHQAGMGSENIHLTLLGQAHLSNADPISALKATKKATDMHRAQSFAKPDGYTSQEIWWRHAQALTANKKTKEAREALERAYDLLLETIASIRDEGLRRNALNKVTVNRELLQYWVKVRGDKGGRPTTYPHLAIESNVREPFKRLADTGLRLNALHTVSDIQTFLVEEATELSGGERVMLILEKDGLRTVMQSILPRGEDAQKILRSIDSHLDQSRLTRTAQLTLPKKSGPSRITAPLIAQNQVIGYLYVDMDWLYGTFDETDRDILGLLANQAAVALDNAQWAQGLEQKVEERTEQLQERVNELQIINTIQQGLASELDFQAIVDLVGDKLSEIFKTGDLGIRWYDEKENLFHFIYEYEHGERLTLPPQKPTQGGIFEKMLKKRQLVVLNNPEDYKKHNFTTIPGTDQSKSAVTVPIISGDRVIGTIGIENHERENAFGESELRLLTTIAASLGTALENARLFDETQRLLKITEDRAAELAIINSVQEGLASKLEFQSIIDLVGDKVVDIFKAQLVAIMLYDRPLNLEIYPYIHEKGHRLYQDPIPHDDKGFGPLAMRTLQPVVINSDMVKRMEEVGSYLIGGEDDAPKSAIYAPLLVGNEARGVVSIGVHDRENAYSDSDVRLLQTLANAMSVALENARLFDETQRLLKITEERAAELAILNSVGEAMAKTLDVKTVTRIVGDKVRDIFGAEVTEILLRDIGSDLIHVPYAFAKDYQEVEPFTMGMGLTSKVIQSGKPLIFSTFLQQAEFGVLAPTEEDKTESYMAVPIVAGEKMLGVVSVQSYQQNAYNESHVRLLQTLSSNMGVAIANARLFDEIQRLLKVTEDRAAELAIINSVQEGLADKLDMQAIYDLVGDEIRQMFDAHATIIGTFDHEKQTYTVPYVFDEGQRVIDEEALPFSAMIKHIIATRQPVVINENMVEASKAYGLVVIEGTNAPKSLIYVPYGTGAQVNGYFSLQNMEHENAFAESDVRLLQTLAGSMGIALENARLFNAEQQRVDELAILNSVGEAMAKTLDVKTVTRIVGDKVRDIFSAEVTEILLVTDNSDLIHVPYAFAKDYQEVEPFAMGTGLTSKVILSRKPLIYNTFEEASKLGALAPTEEDKTESYMAVPIIAGEKVLGVVSVQSYQQNAFNANHVSLLQTLSSNMGIAIQNARLFEETEQRNAELAIINSVQEGLASKLDMQAIYELVGEKIREVFNVQVVDIVTYDPASNLISMPYSYEKGDRSVVSPREPYGFRLHVINSREPLLIDKDIEQAGAQYNNPVVIGEMPKTALFVPLLIAEQVKGIISLQDLDHENAYTESDVRLLQTLANAMSIALENARLFDETQSLLKITEDRAAELAIINSVQEGLASKLDMQAIYELVGNKIRDIFDAQVVDIGLYDHDENLVHFPYAIERGVRFPDEPIQLTGFRKHVVQTRQPLLINQDVETVAAQYGNAVIQGEMPRSALFVPMLVGSEAKGVISLQNLDRENAFSNSDVSLLTTLSNAMSVALENARLFAETQRLLNITEVRAAELAIINSVQEGLASKLDMQAIYDLVGDKIRDIFDAQVVDIGLHDETDDLLHFPYTIERGVRFPDEPMQVIGFRKHVMETRQSLLINQNNAEVSAKYGNPLVIQGEASKSMLYVPMIVGGEARGVISLQNLDRENAFSESDVRLLETLSNAMSIALENARLFDETQRLLKITEDRAAELAIINSVQQALAAELNIQGIYDAVGDKIREIFHKADMNIRIYDPQTNLVHVPYIYESGERITIESSPLGDTGFESHVLRTRETVVVNENMAEEVVKYGSYTVPGTQVEKSSIYVPLVAGDQARGLINIVDMQREHAFSESDVRLLQTLANSMSVALENARLFNETQRLLKVTEDRAAELAIINSVQEGLASKLDMQAIYDLVGDKLAEVMNTLDIDIRLFLPETHQVMYPYMRDHGKRIEIPVQPLIGFSKYIHETRQTIVINEKMMERMAELGSMLVPGTQMEKSYIAVPIMVGGRALGMVSISNYEKENAFNDSNVRLLQTVVSAMSVALENARLFNETQRLLKVTEDRAAELAVINSIQEGISAELDFQTIIDLVGDKLREVFRTGELGIRWFDSETKQIQYLYEYEHGERIEVPPVTPAPNSTWHKLVATRQPIIFNTMADYGDIPNVPGTDQGKSMVNVPIIGSDRVLGSILLENYQKEYAYGESEIRLLTTVAASMGVALENARLFNETQRLLKETEERNAELAIINSISQVLTQELDLRSLVDLVGDKLRAALQTENIGIGLYNKESNLLTSVYVYKSSERVYPEPAPLNSFSLRLARQGKSMVMNEVTHELWEKFGSNLTFGRDIPKSVMMIPILAGGELIGGITVQNFKIKNSYPESMVRMLETIASNMGTAMQNARLFDETQRLLKETEQRAAELAIINSIQKGLSSQLDFQAIVDLVGDKVHEIFNSDTTYIYRYDSGSNLITKPYYIERGYRHNLPSMPLGEGLTSTIIKSRKPLLLHTAEEADALNVRSHKIISPDKEKDLNESYLGVPVLVGEEVVGVMSVQSYQQHVYAEGDVHLLSTLAASMSVALENARLFDETQRLLKETEQRAQELAAISTVSQALVAETELDSTIQLIGDQMREIFNADIVYVALLDPQTNLIRFPYQVGESFTTLKIGEGHTGRIIQTGEPLLFNKDVDGSSEELGVTRLGREALSYVGVPIKTAKGTIGVLSVQSTTKEGLFNESSMRLLTTIASNAGAAIQTAQLHAETQRNAQEMATLAEIGNDIAATRELEPVLEKIASHAKNILHVRDIAVYLRESDSDTFHAPVVLGTYSEEIKSSPVILGKGITGAIAQSGRAEFLNYPGRDPRAFHVPGTSEEGEDQEGMMTAPLISRGQTIGVITVWRPHVDGLFTQPDLDFLISVARQTAIAIESARLYLETQRRAREMSALVEVGRDISSSLEASTVLEGIAKHARDLLNSDTSALFLPEGNGKVFRAIAAVGEIADELRDDTIEWGQGILGSIAKNKIGEIVNDANNDPRAVTVSGTEDIPYEHIMAAPLLANDEIKGLMAVWRTGKGLEFTNFELEFLNNLSRQAVIAVQNSQHFTEAKELRVAAETANHAKSAFMANMSHELRTPLNAIIGFTRIVRRKAEGVLPDKQTENLDKVLSSGEHLLGLINTVLDIAKIEAGRMDVSASNFNINGILDQCISFATPLLKPGVILEKGIDPEIPMLYSDQDKIKQIILNLLSNAAKFTHSGSIRLNIRHAENQFMVDITDSGIGMTEEALGRIFEEFQQADNTTTRQYGGTGLGLAISRNLARLLGGDLVATSEPGIGSTFTLTLPIHYVDEKTAAASDAKPDPAQGATQSSGTDITKKLVLVIDDDPDAVYLLQENLGSTEFEVIGARDGIIGQQQARELKPHAILLDVMMPGKDGWQVLHDLKADPLTTNIPVILLTIIDKKALGFRLGASAYLLKPLDPIAVLDALNHVSSQADRPQKHVLVVDDDPHIADMLHQILPASDFVLASAEDGIAGLESIKSNRPDVVLLDLMMPRLDGFGVIEQLRANPETQNLPIIVISAKELTDDEARKLKESVAFVMKKQGFDGEKLTQEINNLLNA